MSLGMLQSAVLIPPLNMVPLTIAGLALARRWPRLGRAMVAVGLGGLVLLSVPLVSLSLLRALEAGLPLAPPPGQPPGAIVVLSAEDLLSDPGAILAGVDAGPMTLARLRAGALLHRRTGLPLLVTGGVLQDRRPPVAETMALALQRDFGMTARFIEPRSIDTWENAAFSAELLRAAGIGSVYVVTDGWHLRRALIAFRRFGIAATAAPVTLRPPPEMPDALIPRIGAWLDSYFALHEWIGCAYYALR